MAKYRKFGRPSNVRVAMLRSLTTSLLYRGRIITTETRAKEIRGMAEHLITVSKKEMNNYDNVTITAKVPKKETYKDVLGQEHQRRVKTVVNGKKETVFEEIQKTIKKDQPSRLNARRKILAALYPVKEDPVKGKAKKAKEIDMANFLFDNVAPKYADRTGGYTRIIKLGPRKGDGACEVVIELV